jgi:amino acid transporter
MELALFVYLAGVVGNIGGFLVLIALVSGFALLAYILAYVTQSRYSRDEWEFKKKYIGVPLLAGFIAAVFPSEKTMYMMLAGYTGQQVLQSETASKVHKVIDAKLDEYIKEMTETKEKK